MSKTPLGLFALLVVFGLSACTPNAREVIFDASQGDGPWIFPDGPLPDGLDAGISPDVAKSNEAGADGATQSEAGLSPDLGDVDAGPGPDQGSTVSDAGGACTCPTGQCTVTFSYQSSTAQTVTVKGSFDSWGAGKAMTKSGSSFSVSLCISHGTKVLYKFQVDGASKWIEDPQNPNKESDNYGGYNSVVNVSCPPQCLADAGVGPSPDSGTTPSSFDWRDGIMYFVLLDRFSNGNSQNDKPEQNVKTPANWQGGDLAGLLAKLKAGYFTGLGVNVIWISSPVDAPDGRYIGSDKEYYTGYHGYWPTELTKVEERLGDLTLLKSVVSEAHSRGIKVVMDYVMNHVHQNSSVYKNNKSWFYSLNYNGKNCVCGAGCSWDNWPESERCWFQSYLPDFDFGNSTAARTYSINNAIKWIQDTGVDGYRLDAVKHISTHWLTGLRSEVKSKIAGSTGKRFYMVGETFSYDKGTLKGYINPSTMLDGQFDFPLRAELARVILRREGSFTDLDNFLNANAGYYGSNAIMGTFIGNHDLPRSIHLAEDTPLFGYKDDGKNRAWYNTPAQPSYERPYQRLGVAFTALMTLPGIPLIYYGDEVGLAGAGDPDNRRAMPWSGLNSHQSALKTLVAKLTKIRSQNKALRYGTRKEHWKGSSVYVYSMTHGSEHLVVVLNRTDTNQTVSPALPKSGSYTDLISGKTGIKSPITIGPRSSMILK